MEKNTNKEIITERSDKVGLKSNLSKNIPMDISQNSLLSSDVGKKDSNKKSNEIKQLNLVTERSINKKIKKQLENDSLRSFDNFDNQFTQKKKNNKKNENKKKIVKKIFVDNIENIYANLVDKINTKYYLQKIFLLIIAFFVNVCRWLFLFISKEKLENNYCFTKFNQFDNCVPEQICENSGKINIILYNYTFEIKNNSLTEHQIFLEEMKTINEYYRPFFVTHNYYISKGKLFSAIDMIKYIGDRVNFVIILGKKEKWNIYINFSSICHKDQSYFYTTCAIIICGIIGSLIFGLFADVYGRKKLICILLFVITLSFIFFSILSLKTESKFDYYLKEYKNNSSYQNQLYFDILSKIYSQNKTSEYFEKNFLKYLLAFILICFSLRSLGKITLALLLENSISELNVLENFRYYTFVTTGLPPFFTYLIFIVINNFVTTIIIMTSISLILFLCSFFLLNESMRYHYEYCEWKNLTDEVNKLFKITDDIPINTKNNIEFEAFRLEENRLLIGNLMKKINSVFDLVKQRIVSLNRDIRRNSNYIIKKVEVTFNPLIVYTSISANRVFNKLKSLMVIILIIIYVQVYFVEVEMVDFSFFNKSDLNIDIYNNYIINSNYFFLAIVTFLSNYFYYLCYRISLFKMTFYFSLILVTFLFILYHYLTYDGKDYPLHINQTNFNMLGYRYKEKRTRNINILLFCIHFFLNGTYFYINLLVIKLTKTIYRCSLFGIDSCLALLSFGFGETLNYQIQHYFLLIGALNLIGIVSEFYFGEMKGIPNLINDLKQNINKENNFRNKEKNKKL